VGPKHAVNLVVGHGFPTVSSFGPHSSYIADLAFVNTPVTAIYGISEDPFVLVDNTTGFELNGVIAKLIDYSAGWNAGKNTFTYKFDSMNYYAHAGVKVGGMPLDGEGFTGAADAMHPWAEDSLTLDGFVYGSSEHFPDPADTTAPVRNGSTTYGASARGQLGSAELDVGYYHQRNNRGTGDLGQVDADVLYSELSYVVFPWLVPAVRAERIALKPAGGVSVNDLHLMPGIAFLVRANIKVVAVANFEIANGFPSDPAGSPLAWSGGAADWGNFVLAPTEGATPTTSAKEVESVAVFFAFAL
jgi:hypothetical protein